MTQLRTTERLLDGLGSRSPSAVPPGDDLAAALAAWADQVDMAPASCGSGTRRVALRRRRLRRTVTGGALTLAMLTGSSVAAALTGTDIPALTDVGRAVVAWMPGDEGPARGAGSGNADARPAGVVSDDPAAASIRARDALRGAGPLTGPTVAASEDGPAVQARTLAGQAAPGPAAARPEGTRPAQTRPADPRPARPGPAQAAPAQAVPAKAPPADEASGTGAVRATGSAAPPPPPPAAAGAGVPSGNAAGPPGRALVGPSHDSAGDGPPEHLVLPPRAAEEAREVVAAVRSRGPEPGPPPGEAARSTAGGPPTTPPGRAAPPPRPTPPEAGTQPELGPPPGDDPPSGTP
ncbi:hypothetical protein GCM10011509_11850 [Ornithinimicrobium pekingense]|uniref:DUF5667 domain-containing protein n=1 Tax=Ornithinimicrobium pekingense TaxID=384677 RepID=A0ABQ2F682_9MICO|nr:hypothetical protein GCM10011509_11850 [Ornithinimicrobium pekingense]